MATNNQLARLAPKKIRAKKSVQRLKRLMSELSFSDDVWVELDESIDAEDDGKSLDDLEKDLDKMYLSITNLAYDGWFS